MTTTAFELARAHVDALEGTLDALRQESGRLIRWGEQLGGRLAERARLLVAGNGGSAAEAQHLTAELVGRFRNDRAPFSAVALHADTSSLTAIGNDYGYDEVFARQIDAHARPRDVVLLLSTSGRSRNLLLAAAAARRPAGRSAASRVARPDGRTGTDGVGSASARGASSSGGRVGYAESR